MKSQPSWMELHEIIHSTPVKIMIPVNIPTSNVFNQNIIATDDCVVCNMKNIILAVLFAIQVENQVGLNKFLQHIVFERTFVSCKYFKRWLKPAYCCSYFCDLSCLWSFSSSATEMILRELFLVKERLEKWFQHSVHITGWFYYFSKLDTWRSTCMAIKSRSTAKTLTLK